MIDILPALILAPLLGTLCVSLIQGTDKNVLFSNCRDVGMLTTGVVFVLSILLYMNETSIFSVSLIPDIYLNYTIHANGLSKHFILGLALCGFITVWMSYFGKVRNIRSFVFNILILEFLAINLFLTENIIVFVMLFEIAFYIIVLQIYKVNDKKGATQLFIMVALSLLNMIVVLNIVFKANTADMSVIKYGLTDIHTYTFEWAVLLISFASRIPVFLMDGWHKFLINRMNPCFLGFVVAYPVLLSLYAIIRVHIFIFNKMSALYAPWVMVVALICMLFAYIRSIQEQDIKNSMGRLVQGAGALLCGAIFFMQTEIIALSVFYLLSYSISIVGIFAIISIICERYKSTKISDIIIQDLRLPGILLAGLFCIGSISFMPFTSGFVFFTGMLSVWSEYSIVGFTFVLVSVLSTCILSMYFYYILFYSSTHSKSAEIVVLSKLEYWFIRFLIAIILIQGVFPLVFMYPIESYLYTIGGL